MGQLSDRIRVLSETWSHHLHTGRSSCSTTSQKPENFSWRIFFCCAVPMGLKLTDSAKCGFGRAMSVYREWGRPGPHSSSKHPVSLKFPWKTHLFAKYGSGAAPTLEDSSFSHDSDWYGCASPPFSESILRTNGITVAIVTVGVGMRPFQRKRSSSFSDLLIDG